MVYSLAHKRRIGTVSVDFAGDLDEARAFAHAHGKKFPHGLTLGRGGGERSPNGDRMLFARYTNPHEKAAILFEFSKLGWGEGETL